MSDISYFDFDISIEAAGDGYRARVLKSPAGEGTSEFQPPFSPFELENLLLRIGRSQRGVRRIDSPATAAAKSFGGRLFDAVFSGSVKTCFDSSLDAAERKDKGLRLRFRLNTAADLASLPWEFLYSKPADRFFSLSRYTPIIRYLELAERARALAIRPPLRVLVAIASPIDQPALDAEREWERLRSATLELQQVGLLMLERLDRATMASLAQRLSRADYNVFHFIGHGTFDPRTDDGALVFEDESRRARIVGATQLGMLFRDNRKLRLAVLNACEGARASATDPFSGLAQNLIRQGTSAVVAMQFEVSDKVSITFAEAFYTAVADGEPVDSALAQARKAIYFDGNETEWGTPVLYLRSPNGRVFEMRNQRGAVARADAVASLNDHEPPAQVPAESATPARGGNARSGREPKAPVLEGPGPGRFFTAVEVWTHIVDSGLAKKDDRVKRYFLLFQSPRRRVWLVLSDLDLFCVSDDRRSSAAPMVEWRMGMLSVQSVGAKLLTETHGRVTFNARQKARYSTNLHSDPSRLITEIRSMLPIGGA